MSRVFVGRLSYDCRERDLEDLFKSHGEITHVTVKNGYGFVEFSNTRDAESSLSLSGTELLGGKINVEMAKPKRDRDYRDRDRDRYDGRDRRRSRERDRRSPERYRGGRDNRRSGFRVIVENLGYDVSWQDLKDFIKSARVDVTFTDAHKLRRGEGIVEFPTERDMEDAIRELDGQEVKGRKVYLRRDRGGGRDDRGPRRGRSYSRSRSRSPPRRRRRSHSRSQSSDHGHEEKRAEELPPTWKNDGADDEKPQWEGEGANLD